MFLTYEKIDQMIALVNQRQRSVLNTAILTVTTACLIGFAIKITKKSVKHGAKKIPSPKGDYFYFGHLPLMGKCPGHKITEWHRELGPIFQLKAGVQNWVFIGDPKMAHEIFSIHGSKSSGRPFLNYAVTIHSDTHKGVAFIQNDKGWRNMRRAILETYSPQCVDDMHEAIQKSTQCGIELMVQSYIESSDKGVEPLKYTRFTSANIMFSSIFGLDGFKSLEDPDLKELEEIILEHVNLFNTVNDLGTFFPLLLFLDVIFQRESKMKDFVHNRHRPYYSKLITKGLQMDRKSLIKSIVTIDPLPRSDLSNIVVTAVDVMIGGADTSSYGIAFVVSLLSHYPEWQKKIAKELDAFFEEHGRFPKYTERSKLPCTLAYMKEAMRYKTSAALGLPHRATEDIVYKDYIIPKDTILFGNGHTANLSATHYKDPETFDPERYMNDFRSIHASSKSHVDNREMFNFGWGRRMCPGIYLAEVEIFTWLCHLLAEHTVEPYVSPDGKVLHANIKDVIDYGGIMSPLPFKIQLVKRKA
ncbi:cytochrome P450 [Sporodiniella umbellata]|nr:cytochrome P450 [Sporodiniella umbellata]